MSLDIPTKHAKWNPEFMASTKPTILPALDRVAVPWKNGNGTTTQVAISPATATIDNFDWRVSIATISGDAPFSRFDGVSRWIMPLDPEGFTMRVEGETTRLADREAFAFPGGSTVHAIKVRPGALDLSLMVRNTRAKGSLLALVIQDNTAIAAGPNESVVIVVLEGTPSVDEKKLEILDAIELPSGTDVVLTGDAVVAIARITSSAPQ
jgi:environmental stress-induced protein Ves